MANYHILGFTIIVMCVVLSLLYDDTLEMYQCTGIKEPPASSSGITRLYSPKNSAFDISSGKDVIVWMHIQKTGGSEFILHLLHYVNLETPCRCKAGGKKPLCQCRIRPGSKKTWIFSEVSTGWVCGVHADWTKLTKCVPHMLDKYEGLNRKRRYFYITLLRDPTIRYLSEWLHVQRGATWKSSIRNKCDGRVPSCYPGLDWSGVSLEEFMGCQYNLANNRQTRMLADLSEVSCYNLSKLNDAERIKMLESAKRNLRQFAFFGLMEYQEETQLLFESTFNLKLTKDLVYKSQPTRGTEANSTLSDEQAQRVHQLNQEDIVLYDYAKKLFWERVASVKQTKRKRA